MTNRTTLFFGITTLALLAFAVVKTKQAPEVCVNFFDNKNRLYIGVDNSISIVVNQDEPIELEQVSAEIYGLEGEQDESYTATIRKEGSMFVVRINKGMICILKVKTKNGVVKKEFHVSAIKPVIRLGKHRNTALKNGEFKAQGGLIAFVECCGFDARCDVKSFEVLRITAQDQLFRASNVGGKFTEAALLLIRAAQPGDVFLFRKIMYRCPGDKDALQDDDFTIEIE